MKIDIHNHVRQDNDAILRAGDELGIDLFCCAFGTAGHADITRGNPDIETVRAANDEVLAATRQFPDRIAGWCFLNPGYQRESLDEMDRCIRDGGLIGVKLYNQYFYNEPVLFPIVQRCIEWQVPIIGHAGKQCHPDGIKTQPRISNGLHFADLARRYPEAILIEGHICGGGDWEWSLKAIRDVPNVWLDTSGSVVDEGCIDRCVRQLGHERLVFGTDMSYEEGVGKILAANLTDEQREDVFWRTARSLLDRRRI
ncbi:MAG: amidohydrolase [Phycisphaerae bacterium]|nr:amidohydrolase [Phycisphaerae bacterium]